MKKLYSFLFCVAAIAAQPVTRSITLIPTNPNPVSVIVSGTVYYTGPSATGPWTQIGCVGTVSGSSCVPGSNALTPFTDPAETVGTTVYYQATFIGPVCVVGQTVPCGNASTVSPAVPIPAKISSPGLTTIIIN